MTFHIEIPDSIAESLRSRLGNRLERKALEDLAVQWYGEGLITAGQVAEMLGVAWQEAQQLLQSRNVGHSLSIDEIRHDADILRELRER